MTSEPARPPMQREKYLAPVGNRFLGRPVRSVVTILAPKKQRLPSLDSFRFSGLAKPRHSPLNVDMIVKLLRRDCSIQGHCPWFGRNDLESPSRTALRPGCYSVTIGSILLDTGLIVSFFQLTSQSRFCVRPSNYLLDDRYGKRKFTFRLSPVIKIHSAICDS
jgi:hypothetical protein